MKRLRGVDRGPAPGARAIAAYIRVSSPSQDHDYQRHAIEAAARARGELVAHWYADVASGRSMDRPELRRLRASLDSGAVARIWVWRLDRLTRSGVLDTLEWVEHVRACGAELASVADGFALDGPAAELVLAVLAWAARAEREKIAENQAAARARLEATGRSWGRPPLAAQLIDAAVGLASQGKTTREISAELHISKASVGRILLVSGVRAAAEKTRRRRG